MTDQQILGLVWQLQQKVDDLEGKLRKIERIVTNVGVNAAQTANMVRQLLNRK